MVENILTVQDASQDSKPVTVVALIDPWSGDKIWSRNFQRKFRGVLGRRGKVAIVEPSGKASIIELETGESVTETEVKYPGPKGNLLLNVSDHQFLLTCATKKVIQKDVTYHDGRVYAIHRPTGKLQWQTPLSIENLALHHAVASELPVLAYYRLTAGQNNRQSRMELTIIDKRDGRLVWQKKLTVKRQGLNVRGDLGTNQLSLRLPDSKIYELEFTKDPISPAPVARLAKKGAGVSSVLDAFSKGFLNPIKKN